jgi:hypothetical protein
MTHDAAVERLGDAGCTEPLVGIGRAHVLALAYERSLSPDERIREISVIAQALLGAELLP